MQAGDAVFMQAYIIRPMSVYDLVIGYVLDTSSDRDGRTTARLDDAPAALK